MLYWLNLEVAAAVAAVDHNFHLCQNRTTEGEISMVYGKLQIKFLLLLLALWSCYASADELTLSPSEQAYLQKHPVITMCVDPDWMPYEKLDDQGRHIGLVAEYMALLQSRLGITIKAKKTASWTESQQLYQQGSCDIVSALNETPERTQYLTFTKPYIKSPAVLILNEQNKTDSRLSDLHGKTLAMVKGYVYESRLHEQYPDIKIVYVPNMEVALQKVSAQEIDATLGPFFLTFALIQELGLDDLKTVGNTEYQDELRIGIQKDNKKLADLFDMAVASLTPGDHAQVRSAWTMTRTKQK